MTSFEFFCKTLPRAEFVFKSVCLPRNPPPHPPNHFSINGIGEKKRGFILKIRIVFSISRRWAYMRKKEELSIPITFEYGFDQQRLIWYVCRLWDMVFSGRQLNTISYRRQTYHINLC